MAHTSAAHVSDFTNTDFTPEQTARVVALISWAERYVMRRAGWDFYDPSAPDAPQSLDWIEVTCRVVARMLVTDDPKVQEHVNGPYSSERNADYQYTMRTTIRAEDLRSDPAIDELIGYWSEVSPAVPAVVNVGPTRTAAAQDTGSESSILADVSRGTWPRDWWGEP